MRLSKMTYRVNAPIILIFVLFFGSCQTPGPVQERKTAGFSAERLAKYDGFIQSEIDQRHIAGAVSLIMRNGQVAHNKVFGVRNINEEAPMVSDDIFFIQSMTKPIITVAFMMLYEEGHFDLNDRVSSYLPQFDSLVVSTDPWGVGIDAPTEPLNEPVRIKHLLSHTAGLSHGLGQTGLEVDYRRAMYVIDHLTVESRVDSMLQLPLIAQPGERWYYSAAPDVLSVLIAKFSGKSTAQFLQERIFNPLGMNDTGYNVPEIKADRIVSVHEVQDGQLIVPEWQSQYSDVTIHSGVNGLFSTAPDYMRFCQMLLNNGKLDGYRYLSRKTVELMTLNHVGGLFGNGGGFGFGFGVVSDLAEWDAPGSEGQYFWGGAFSTYFFIDPKENLVSILMTQLNPYSSKYADMMGRYVYSAIDK